MNGWQPEYPACRFMQQVNLSDARVNAMYLSAPSLKILQQRRLRQLMIQFSLLIIFNKPFCNDSHLFMLNGNTLTHPVLLKKIS